MNNRKKLSIFLLIFGCILIAVGNLNLGENISNNINTDKPLLNNIPGDKTLSNNVNYNIYRYQTDSKNKLELIGDYIVEYQNDKGNYKIMDLKANVLYEGDFSNFHNFINLNDELLYLKNNKYTNINNKKSNELEKGFHQLVNSSYIRYSKTYEENYNITSYGIGFYKEIGSNTLFKIINNDDTNDITLNMILATHLMNLPTENNFNKHLIFLENDDKQFGLYNVKKKNWQINPKYNRLVWFNSNKYIACQIDNSKYKCGVIDEFDNVLIPFDYNHSSVGKNHNYIELGIDNKYIFYDNNLNIIGTFIKDQDSNIPDILGGLLLDSNNYFSFENFRLKQLNDSYLIYRDGYGTNEYVNAYIVNKDGIIKELSYNDIFVRNEIVVLVDYVNKIMMGIDYDLNETYKINLPDIKNKAQTEANQTVIYFDVSEHYLLENGEKITTNNNYIEVIDEAFKVYHEGIKKYLLINNEKINIIDNENFYDNINIYETEKGYIIMSKHEFFSNFFTYLEKK